jgi:inosose dehydratase
MTISRRQVAFNPLQYVATADGWIDRTQAPPLAELMARIAAAGFAAVHTDVPHGDAHGYARAVRAAGLATGPGYIGMQWHSDADAQQQVLDAARRTAADSAAIGNTSIFIAMAMARDAPRVARPGVGAEPSPQRLEQVRDFLGRACEIVLSEGVRPALHPHAGTWIETEDEVRYVLDTLPPSLLDFGPDSGHLAWTGIDPAALIRDYQDRVTGLHIKDYRSDIMRRSREEPIDYRSAVGLGVWAEPGYGDGNVDDVLAALPDEFDGWVVIEVDRGSTPDPDESMRRCADWLDSLSLVP